MKNVLFYGDSNTWGYQGDDPMHRLDADKRYTGVVAAQFPDVHFIEEGLCGRTICSTDPIDYGRNGMAMLPALLATHDPLDVIVIMLGTNDSKTMYGHSPFTISDAMDRTIKLMQSPLLWSNTMQKPQILLVAPPKMGENLADSVYYGMFNESSAALIRALPARFRTLAEKYGCAFVDGSAVTAAKCSDQIHLTQRSTPCSAGSLRTSCASCFNPLPESIRHLFPRFCHLTKPGCFFCRILSTAC